MDLTKKSDESLIVSDSDRDKRVFFLKIRKRLVILNDEFVK